MCVFAFDLLFVDGQPLLQEPLRRRQALMDKALPGRAPGWFELASSVVFEATVQADVGAARAADGTRCPAVGEGGDEGVAGGKGPIVSTIQAHQAIEAHEANKAHEANEAHEASGCEGAVVQAQRAQHEMLEEQLLAALAAGVEGLMLKRLDSRSTYEPSKRSDTCVPAW